MFTAKGAGGRCCDDAMQGKVEKSTASGREDLVAALKARVESTRTPRRPVLCLTVPRVPRVLLGARTVCPWRKVGPCEHTACTDHGHVPPSLVRRRLGSTCPVLPQRLRRGQAEGALH